MATPFVVKNQNAGNRFLSTTGKVLQLQAVSGIGNWSSFLTIGPGVAYIVPAGKKLVVFGIAIQANTFSNSCVGLLGWGDTAVTDSVTAPTNPKTGQLNYWGENSATPVRFYDVYLEIPEGKYPVMRTNAGSGGSAIIQLFAVEVDA